MKTCSRITLCPFLPEQIMLHSEEGYSWTLSTGGTRRERRNNLMPKTPRRRTRRGHQQKRKGQHPCQTGDRSLREALAMIPITKGHHPLSALSRTRLRRAMKRESEWYTVHTFLPMFHPPHPPTQPCPSWAFVCCPETRMQAMLKWMLFIQLFCPVWVNHSQLWPLAYFVFFPECWLSALFYLVCLLCVGSWWCGDCVDYFLKACFIFLSLCPTTFFVPLKYFVKLAVLSFCCRLFLSFFAFLWCFRTVVSRFSYVLCFSLFVYLSVCQVWPSLSLSLTVRSCHPLGFFKRKLCVHLEAVTWLIVTENCPRREREREREIKRKRLQFFKWLALQFQWLDIWDLVSTPFQFHLVLPTFC